MTTTEQIVSEEKIGCVLSSVSRVFVVPAEEIRGHSRKWPLVGARFAVWLLMKERGLNLERIAEAFGVHPTTIGNGIRRGRELIETDKDYARKIKQLLEYEIQKT